MARKQSELLTIVPCCDHQRRTCLQVERLGDVVKYIPLDVADGLRVHTAPKSEFDRRYQPMVDYPAEKAAQLYLGYSQTIGATKEALSYLGQVVNVSKQEFEMATKKSGLGEKPAATKPAATKPAATKPAATKPAATKPGAKKPSAAQMFQDLIMAGKLTDDQIFEKVQAEFGLDEKKRGYVKWYRNYLRKQGKNPPEPKAAK